MVISHGGMPGQSREQPHGKRRKHIMRANSYKSLQAGAQKFIDSHTEEALATSASYISASAASRTIWLRIMGRPRRERKVFCFPPLGFAGSRRRVVYARAEFGMPARMTGLCRCDET